LGPFDRLIALELREAGVSWHCILPVMRRPIVEIELIDQQLRARDVVCFQSMNKFNDLRTPHGRSVTNLQRTVEKGAEAGRKSN
jgi:hypothetical protein